MYESLKTRIMIIRNSTKIIKEYKGLTAALTGADNLPLTQEYDEATGIYFPDRTLLPVIIVPDIREDDGTAVPDTDIATKAWYTVGSDGTETQILSTTPGFELYPTGHTLGLKVKKNISPSTSVGLVFRFTARGFAGMAGATLRTDNNPAPTPDLELDFPAASVWNPFDTDRDTVTVTPTVRDFGHTSLAVEWLKLDGTSWRAINPSDPKDAELELDTATNALTIDRRWMGESISLVCRLSDTGGSTPVVIRERPVTIRRRIPEYTAEIMMSSVFGGSDASVMAQANIRAGKSRLTDPSKELKLTWYDGNTSVGSGNAHSYKTGTAEVIDAGLGIEDRGPMKLLTYNGAYLTYDGKLLGGR